MIKDTISLRCVVLSLLSYVLVFILSGYPDFHGCFTDNEQSYDNAVGYVICDHSKTQQSPNRVHCFGV